MRILAGDLGGTKTLLRILDSGPAGFRTLAEARYESRSQPRFDLILEDFLRGRAEQLDRACFAVAGPVTANRAAVTNLVWELDAAELADRFSIERVTLINDFFGVAAGIPTLDGGDLLEIQRGVAVEGEPLGVLGAGTGLGQALVVSIEGRWHVLPSEGGHCDFAPASPEQDELLAFLRHRYGHVSYERVLSGGGLADLYEFHRTREAGGGESWGAEVLDSATEVARRAELGERSALRAMETFVDVYGAEAGNVALKALTRGGIYIAGGIAAKNRARFLDGRFVRAFVDKGRFRDLLETIPVRMITAEDVAVRGAAAVAAGE